MAEAQAADEPELRLRWRHTWPDKGADYAASAEGYEGSIGRIHVIKQGPQDGRWAWSMYAHGPEIDRRARVLDGTADTPREAARCVENAWFAVIEGTSFDRPAPPVNAYATAKAR